MLKKEEDKAPEPDKKISSVSSQIEPVDVSAPKIEDEKMNEPLVQ